ncbi:MAG TPA: folylpolyglutamate synthase/dihydrofolate synthase family protein [Flavobacteriales bacterium]|nr:folylpolyglutamate synthase/dihydrofolate synthase family protein [Flavobacteriales bacterium]HMR26954.1 folylpolyglutamate synthase/dihydrofolate synthase family protein [Flavobacteriales bacterium]
MTYPETLAYLQARLPMFHRVGKAAYKADLRTTEALMEALGHPEHGLRCVHVAGTNGKGSTSHMLASILQHAGLRTGLTTSPHLTDFRERVRVNGAMIPQEDVVRFVEDHRAVFEPLAPSFFEWSIALAFDHFRQEQVDIAVVETGLGGRLDSTNVITPEVAVITTIGWDHADLLGGTLEAIAAEKAGIIKSGIPVVIGEAEGSIDPLFRARAGAVGAPLIRVDHQRPLPIRPDLAGPHQERNARTVLTVVDLLRERGWPISEEAVLLGLSSVVTTTGLRGRWQVLGRDPLVVADVAHNADGLAVVRGMLDRTPHRRLHVVLGMVNDKDLGPALRQLPPDARYHFCMADIPRGLDAELLARAAADNGLHGRVHPSVRQAFVAACAEAAPDDLVLVTGSVFVVAEVL